MAYGSESVRELIASSDLSYPISVSQLEREFALENITIDKRGNSVMLVEVLKDVNADRFEDEDDLVEKLEPAFERHRRERGGGLLDRLKRVFSP